MTMLATIAALAISAMSATEVSVRTSADYIVGTDCDPEIVSLFEPHHGGVVDANCATVTPTAEPGPEPDLGADNIIVTLGAQTFTACRLVTMQRNHFPTQKTPFTAWGFACATPLPRKPAR